MKQTPFSNKILELRKTNHYTQSYVAKILGITKRQYAYLEYGNFTCDYWNIIKLCQLYKISANELFGIKKISEFIFPIKNMENKNIEINNTDVEI